MASENVAERGGERGDILVGGEFRRGDDEKAAVGVGIDLSEVKPLSLIAAA